MNSKKPDFTEIWQLETAWSLLMKWSKWEILAWHETSIWQISTTRVAMLASQSVGWPLSRLKIGFSPVSLMCGVMALCSGRLPHSQNSRSKIFQMTKLLPVLRQEGILTRQEIALRSSEAWCWSVGSLNQDAGLPSSISVGGFFPEEEIKKRKRFTI